MHKHIGRYIHVLHRRADQAMTAQLAQMELTASQGRIIGFLAHREHPPCARDVEEEFHLSHPTVSGLLNRLEKKAFIEFRPDENDHRCKRIYLLEKGRQCNERIHRTIRENEERMAQGLSPEEQRLFADFLERAVQNVGGNPCHRNHKEETRNDD